MVYCILLLRLLRTPAPPAASCASDKRTTRIQEYKQGRSKTGEIQNSTHRSLSKGVRGNKQSKEEERVKQGGEKQGARVPKQPSNKAGGAPRRPPRKQGSEGGGGAPPPPGAVVRRRGAACLVRYCVIELLLPALLLFFLLLQ